MTKNTRCREIKFSCRPCSLFGLHLKLSNTATISDARYDSLVQAGWWHGNHLLESVVWHADGRTERGAFSNLTGRMFAARYMSDYTSQVSYYGASTFAACASLCHTIEQVGSLDTAAVVAGLHAARVNEFYGAFQFDGKGASMATNAPPPPPPCPPTAVRAVGGASRSCAQARRTCE